MKKVLYIAIFAMLGAAFACNDDEKSTWEEYTDWREANNAWLVQQQARKNTDGTPYFKTIVPEWNSGSFILIHYFNDRAETEGNLTPMSTSTVDTRYNLHLYDGTPIDSSANVTSTGVKGIFRSQVNSLIPGWGVALSDMRCGDTVEVIIPYQLAYGSQSSGDLKPYSNLQFNLRLENVYLYEATPY